MAKTIALRIKPILSSSMSSEQFVFLEGKQIHEAIGAAQEGSHNMKTLNLKGVFIKNNPSKDFDRVS